MSSNLCYFNQFAIEYRLLQVQSSKQSDVIIANRMFKSVLLAFLLKQSSLLYAYCIYPQLDCAENSFSHEQIAQAERHLESELKAEFSNPKCVNPGILYQWQLSEVVKIIDLLELSTVSYDKTDNKLIPAYAKVGFVFDAPLFYQGSCVLCNQNECSFRQFPFKRTFVNKAIKNEM